MRENGGRRPRFRRVGDFPKLRLTERDEAIIRAVSQFRFLATSDILSLVKGSRQNLLRRLQRLYHAGHLERPKAQMFLRYRDKLRELVYSIPRRGEVSPLFLAHELSISAVMASLPPSCARYGLEFLFERDILALSGCERSPRSLRWTVNAKSESVVSRVGIVPDAAFAIQRRANYGTSLRFYFLESDCGTMPVYRRHLRLSSIRRKAVAYIQTRRAGLLRKRLGIPAFQVLFVSRTRERMERMKEECSIASQGRFPSLFLFAVFDDVVRENNLLAVRWQTCGGDWLSIHDA